jgi:hypothetical protein
MSRIAGIGFGFPINNTGARRPGPIGTEGNPPNLPPNFVIDGVPQVASGVIPGPTGKDFPRSGFPNVPTNQ